MVLDVHHHNCNNEGENIYDMLGEIFGTWNKQQLPPKIHFSSPRDGELDRKHADYIDASSFIDFIEKIMGKSEFKGVSSVDAFCGAWDTRL